MSNFRKWLIHKLGGHTESYIRISKDGIEVISGNKNTFTNEKKLRRELMMEEFKDEN